MTKAEAPQYRWKQQGIISLWRYTECSRSYSGWHLSADAVGCASLLELLQTLAVSPESAYRTVHVTPPSLSNLKVPNFKSAKWTAPIKWRISFESNEEATNLWSITPQEDSVYFTLGSARMQELVRGVTAISRGDGDYSIGGSESQSRLWFWWWLEDIA